MKNPGSDKRWIRIPLKILMWFVIGVVILTILVFVVLQIPAVQNYAARKAVNYLNEKLQTRVELESINIGFPKTVNIRGLFVADQNNDTLLYAGSVNLGIDMPGLLKNRLHIRSVDLNNITANIYKLYPDTVFNFNFILEAFASEETTESADTSAPMIIDLDKIGFKAIRLTFKDTLAGIDTYAYIGQFETEFTDFDLNKSIFKVSDITLLNSSVSYLQTTPLVKSTDTSSAIPPDISFRTLQLDNFKFAMLNPEAGNVLNAVIGNLKVKSDLIDLPKQKFAIKSISLEKGDLSFEHSKPQHIDTIVEKVIREDEIEKHVAAPEWEFTLQSLDLTDNNFRYVNNEALPVASGMDFNNILVSFFNLNSKNIYMSPGKIDLALNHLGFEEKSGFVLEDFSSKIHYDTTNIKLADLVIRTPNSNIGDHIELNFNSLIQLTEDPTKAEVNLNIANSQIAIRDVLYFVPDLIKNEQVSIKSNDLLSINANIRGNLDDAVINNFKFTNHRATSLAFSGRIKNASTPERLYAVIKGLEVSTSKSDIFYHLKQGMIPESIAIPEQVSLNGEFTGYLKNFIANANISTSFGSAIADIKMDPSLGNRETEYDADIRIVDFDLGKLLLNPDTLGIVNLEASLKGTGMNPDSLNSEVYIIVNDAFYNGYTYKNLTTEGFVVNRSFHGEIIMKDENIDFNYTGYINAHPDSLAALFDIRLNKADLKALNLSPDDFKVKGFIHSDLAKRYGPNPLGKVKIYDLEVERNGFMCPFDSLVIESFYDYDSSVVNIRSDFLNAAFTGDIVLQSLPGTLIDHLNSYFSFSENDSINADTSTVEQDFTYNITLEDPNYICEKLVPELKRYIPLKISGKYKSDDKQLALKADIPLLDYNGTVVDSMSLNISTNRQKLDYQLKVAEISNPTLSIQRFLFEGDIADNSIKYRIQADKADTFNVLRTSGAFSVDDNQYKLIMDEPFVLNNTAWKIDPDNVLTFSDEGLNAQKVILSGENQLISLITQPGDDIPLKISFENFKLSNFSIIVEKEAELVRGILDGHFTMLKVNGVSAFTSDLAIDSLAFLGNPVGNIALLADNRIEPERFDVDLKLTGYGNEMSVTGNYIARDSAGVLNLDVEIPHLNLTAIQPFTFGQVSRMSGFMSADIDIRGTTLKPLAEGYLQFNEAAFLAPYANTYLKIGNNTLNIQNQRLIINELTLTDTLNNTATLTGTADFADFASPYFDFRINTDNFLAMNASNKNDDMPLYGKVLLDSDIRFRGTPANPVIDMSVRLNNGTEVTYVLPEEEMALNESEGIVIFVDSLSYAQSIVADTNELYRSSVEGISLDASITFEQEAILKMMIDPEAGDSLFVNGEGTLNFSLEPGGQMNLTGNYSINSGEYNLTLNNLIKRQFSIAEGSTITWTGDIMDALIDLNAIYTVKTSPMVLLEDQVESMEEASRDSYRNSLTFMVYLKMKGKLTKPEISFDIQQPDNERGALNGTVNARLNELRTDESQLNKQVFSLLTLNRFMGQDPFETGGAPLTVESATRASASKLLTQQFSTLSEKYIKGFDLDVGVNSYEEYSDGSRQGRTQLQLGVTKELLNERLSVQVGGNVEMEGERARSNDVENLAGNVNIEYKLSPKGRYRLRAFRRIEYENPIEGELINSGVGISYSRDFRGFKQLFMSEKKRQERIKQRQAERKSEEGSNESK